MWVQKTSLCEKDHIWNPDTSSCKNRKYLSSIMDDSTIMCDEVIESYDEETKTVSTNLNKKKKVTCKTKKFYILLVFLLVKIALFIAVSIYCYLMRHKAKQKHLLLFYVTNNELRKLCIYNINKKCNKVKDISM